MTEQPCDIFQNGSDEPCAGPRFDDPQPEGVDLRICAFHALLNRNYWMSRARTATRRADRSEKRLVVEHERGHDPGPIETCGDCPEWMRSPDTRNADRNDAGSDQPAGGKG